MEDEPGVKAPVTRLRRRLSVEQSDDVNSPLAPSTPTKKRGGRLAAKPQLELIDENASEGPKRTTRKSVARDVEQPEEKPATPARRSARIKSNTSLVLETTQTVDSPRAKRAARRNSQIGSDTEAPVTPVRQTRRTRKDSTSSIDKQVETAANKSILQITGAISEEPEIKKDDTEKDTPTRKSPRARGSKGRRSNSTKSDNETNDSQLEKKEITEVVLLTQIEPDSSSIDIVISKDEGDKLQDTPSEELENNKLSLSSVNLINDLDTQPKIQIIDKNKSLSAVDSINSNSKRQRTKSWSINNSVSSTHDGNFFSDSESTKKKKKDKSFGLKNTSINTSANTPLNISQQGENLDKNDTEKENAESILNSSTKRKKKQSESSFNKDTEVFNASVHGKSLVLEKSVTASPKSKETESDKENMVIQNSEIKQDIISVQKFFEKSPSSNLESMIYLEDSDSNTGNQDKSSIKKYSDSEDQCVPVIKHQFEQSEGLSVNESISSTKSSRQSNVIEPNQDKNDSCEPMDIDETIPPNVSIVDASNDNLERSKRQSLNTSDKDDLVQNKSKRKSSLILAENINEAYNSPKAALLLNAPKADGDLDSSNKSKRKSSIIPEIEDMNKTSNPGNKSLNSTGMDVVDGNKSINKSKRKSSISIPAMDEDKPNESFNNSKGKSSLIMNVSVKNDVVSVEDPDQLEKCFNKSNTEDDINDSFRKSKRKSMNSSEKNEIIYSESVNNSKRKSSIKVRENDNVDVKDKSGRKSGSFSEINTNNESSNKSHKKSTQIIAEVDDTPNESLNKSKRKSSINVSQKDDINESINKSKRKSSLSQQLEKTGNENKSTLILSQIKDVSAVESSVSKSPKVANNDILSRSVNVPDTVKDKDSERKNLSLDYSTSTPLQQKSLKKLAMQINTSIITSTTENSKVEVKGSKNKSKNISQVSQNSVSLEEDDEEDEESDGEESGDEEESEEESADNSNMLDDEAEEASDDYESGDSQDDDEKQYEKENEILERGETLETDEDLSNDSDYEKDSFIVSSNEEDEELLSGSGDDLSLSDNELTMSAKSKRKYDERKIKQQKKASREMFNARHNISKDKSDSEAVPKKNNRMRLDSTLESEEDVQPKKTKRLRLESSQESSDSDSDKANKSKNVSKNKKKQLKSKVLDDDENEISDVCNESVLKKEDPLSVNIKQEPKTPQKGLNISTVLVTNMKDIEEVQVDENVSVLKPNDTLDPLQATMAQGEDFSSSSDNEEIMNNYDIMLDQLNKEINRRPSKICDISLNLNKKSKKVKEPIVDQLNLTLTKEKKAKNKSNATEKDLDKSQNKEKPVVQTKVTDNEDSSDSIDLQLLFSEESNDEDRKTKNNVAESEPPEEFIPLKRTEGKIHIPETESKDESSSLDKSMKRKNKNRKSKGEQENIPLINNEPETEVSFFIDTVGTHTDLDNTVNQSLNTSKKKKKKNRLSAPDASVTTNEPVEVVEEIVNDDEEAPLEVSYKNTKNKNKKLENNQSINELSDTTENNVNTSIKTPRSEKKKKKRLSELQVEQPDNAIETSENVPKTPSSEKKKKHLSESNILEPSEDKIEKSDDVLPKTPASEKKKKKRVSESLNSEQLDIPESVVTIKTPTSEKKKKLFESQSLEEPEPKVDNEVAESNSKKRKRKLSANPSTETVDDDSKVLNVSKQLNVSINGSQKKKRKISQNKSFDDALSSENQGLEVNSLKEIVNTEEIAVVKPKKKKHSQEQTNEINNAVEQEVVKKSSNKKRKRDDDDTNKTSKVFKGNLVDKVHVSRLPAALLKQLDEQPRKEDLEMRKSKVVSTSNFVVEEAKIRKNKPSNYLEESVYLNESRELKKQKGKIKHPKVLPFMPTASTSGKGFTTEFKVNIIPKETQFIAQATTVANFKNDVLYSKRIKRLGTYETYKKQRNIKMSKF